ncbi:MAG TPA: hypothetical protein VF719_11825 [Abditibacteriaceae bacterium]
MRLVETKNEFMAFVLICLTMPIGTGGCGLAAASIIATLRKTAPKNYSENIFLAVFLFGIFLGALVSYAVWVWWISCFLTLEELKKMTEYPRGGILGKPIARYFIQRKERQG